MTEIPPFLVKIEGRPPMEFTPSEASALRDAVGWYFVRARVPPLPEPRLQVYIILPDGL